MKTLRPKVADTSAEPSVKLPLSRVKALERGVLRLGPGCALLAATVLGFSRLNFVPSAVTNRITDYSIAVALVPLAVIGVALSLAASGWLLLAFWPGRLGILADTDALTFRLGPFGTRRYAVDRLDIRYLFELPEESPDRQALLYEALIDPDEQVQNQLPHIRHPDSEKPLHEMIRQYAAGDEKQWAAALQPFVRHMRRDRPDHRQPD